MTIFIKDFIEKVSLAESKRKKDIVIPVSEARLLRDELSKLLSDYYALANKNTEKKEDTKIQIVGGTFK